jgi:hypothetical protein
MINNMKSYVGKHVNLHCSTTTAELLGVWALDKDVALYSASYASKIAGFLFLRQILYNHVKMSDGHTMFAELHQNGPLSHVETVIPNTPEAESMVETTKKNIAAFLENYLFEAGVDAKFTKELLKEADDVSLIHSANIASGTPQRGYPPCLKTRGKRRRRRWNRQHGVPTNMVTLWLDEKESRTSKTISLTLRTYTTLMAPTPTSPFV